MTRLSRTVALFSACFLIGPGLASAEDAVVEPEAARAVKAVTQDAVQKVQPDLSKDAMKIKQATPELAPVKKKAAEMAPEAGKQLQPPTRK